MGRQIKRVPLGFDWPLGKVWDGYINPHYKELVDCPACGGSSYSQAGKLLNGLWYRHLHSEALGLLNTTFPNSLLGFALKVLKSGKGWSNSLEQCDVDALVDGDRLWDFTRVPRNDEQREIVRQRLADGHNSWLLFDNGYRPTAEEVNEWSKRGFGHDSINAWICQKARAQMYGVELACADCSGTGHVPNAELEQRIESWTETEPPSGEGWQVWETVSEGSPISPVFATDEELVVWLVDQGYSEKGARAFVQSGWVPSMVSVGKSLYLDIESAALNE